jgi:hypothetical protein
MITELKKDEVIVFGTNGNGFHGAGDAGYAFSGTTANDWRTCPLKQAAIKHPNKLNEKTNRLNKVGKWNEWGVSRGFQNGY